MIPVANELSSAVVVVGGGLVVVDGGSVVTRMPDVGGAEVMGAGEDMVSDIPGCYGIGEGKGDRDEREPAAGEGAVGMWEAP